jgi:hypothetical protein
MTDDSKYSRYWRPTAGWMTVWGIGYTLGSPLASWIAAINGLPALPAMSWEAVSTLIAVFLGYGGMRTGEKIAAARIDAAKAPDDAGPTAAG